MSTDTRTHVHVHSCVHTYQITCICQ